MSLSLSLYLSLSLSFFGQVMSPHHTDQMSQRSQVSGVAFWRCSLNVFVFVIVIVFVCVFVIVFLLVRSCLLITLIKCLKLHKSLGSLWCCVFKRCLSQWVSDNVTYWAVGWTAKNEVKGTLIEEALDMGSKRKSLVRSEVRRTTYLYSKLEKKLQMYDRWCSKFLLWTYTINKLGFFTIYTSSVKSARLCLALLTLKL